MFIFNEGRCFEQNRRYDDAIARFQEYLRVGKSLSPEARDEAKKHISDCKDLLATERVEAAPVSVTRAPSAQAAPAPALASATAEVREGKDGAGRCGERLADSQYRHRVSGWRGSGGRHRVQP